ncbi:unnamed protein product [Rotaria socialis]|uniref:Uncharacterized protein n=1 Tax=Rotaria socialis TaxID=392032 RepID=A0A818GLS7_9BILA|nr:unnamed protein product [Rotaria socialis]CAF4714261.1 unnamed protein product [Rotaria socialis]
MVTTDPIDYPFHADEEGWPETVYDPTYPHEYYFDLGKNPNEFKSNVRPPVPIRRHTPGSTDPTQPEIKKRIDSSKPKVRLFSGQKSNRSDTFTMTARNKPSTPRDPDERPIKPMKNTAIYNQPSSAPKSTSRETPLKLPKIKNTPRSLQPDSVRLLPPRRQNNSVTPRRPIFADIYAKPSSRIPSQRVRSRIPLQRVRSRPVIVEEYIYDYNDNDNDNDEDDDEFEPYVEPTPAKIISYKEVSGMTTRERENYMMSRNHHSVPAQPILKRRIFYPN